MRNSTTAPVPPTRTHHAVWVAGPVGALIQELALVLAKKGARRDGGCRKRAVASVRRRVHHQGGARVRAGAGACPGRDNLHVHTV